MSIALYRKYRPKTFGEVTSQNHIKVTLQNELQNGRLAHAYLFCGPRGTGKTTMARLIAKSANCLNLQPGGEPCNNCESCLDTMLGKALDIIEIDAASHTGVENVRENIINNARFSPVKAKFKVFIIDEVHMLSTPAFNALLKILEEPPSHVIFILATTEVHKVPMTILSRCQRFDFKKVVLSDVVSRLRYLCSNEGVSVPDSVLTLVARHSGGCIRDAESLLEQVLSLGDKAITLEQAELIIPKQQFDRQFDLLLALKNKDSRRGLELIDNLVTDGLDLTQFSNNFIEFLRLLMIYKVTGDLSNLQCDFETSEIEKIVELTTELSVPSIIVFINTFITTRETFKYNYILQLPLEMAILSLTENLPRITAEVTRATDDPLPPTVTPEKSKDSTESVAPVSSTSSATEAVVPKSREGMSLTFNQVLARWPIVLKNITTKNYSLGMSLSVARPIGLEGTTLHFGFLFDLQRSRVETPENIRFLQEIFNEEFGTMLNIVTLVDQSMKLLEVQAGRAEEDLKVEQPETTDPLGQVLSAFGGTVVDSI